MKEVKEPSSKIEMAKETVRRNKKVLWFAAKRSAKSLLVAGAVVVVVKVAFDTAVTNEVNKQLSK